MSLPTSFVGHESLPIDVNVNVDIQALVWERKRKPTPMRRETSVMTVSTHPHRATPPQIRIPQPVEADASTGPLHRAPVHWARWLPIWLVLCFMAGIAHGQEPVYPLQPPDRSSPRATLKTFLDSGDALGAFLAREYLTTPSRAQFHRLIALGEAPVQCLDLSETPEAARLKVGRAAAVALYETLNRIALPAVEDIPDAEQMNRLRVMDIVEQSGTGFAFPSRTLYFARDGGLDAPRTESAEAQVRQWRDKGCLPFPNFSPERTQQMRGTVVYPPPGSPEASTAGAEPEILGSNPLRR